MEPRLPRRLAGRAISRRLFVAAALVVAVAAPARAAFQTSFDAVTKGHALPLVWDHVDAASYPLAVTARLINRTDEHKANGLATNLTAHITTGSAWNWENVPAPLPYLSGGLYSVEIRPANWTGPDGAAPVLARSVHFTIQERDDGNKKPGEVVKTDGGAPAGPNRALGLGLGVSIGTSSVIAACIVLYALRKRRKRVIQEKMRMRRDFVIT